MSAIKTLYSSRYVHKDGPYRLTEYGKEYLSQRGGLPVSLPPGTTRG